MDVNNDNIDNNIDNNNKVDMNKMNRNTKHGHRKIGDWITAHHWMATVPGNKMNQDITADCESISILQVSLNHHNGTSIELLNNEEGVMQDLFMPLEQFRKKNALWTNALPT